MNDLQTHMAHYLEYCRCQKRLDAKTLKAYRIDLAQFQAGMAGASIPEITHHTLEGFIASLHQKYKPKTVKRKIASIKSLFRYLEYKEIIVQNPFHKMQIKFRGAATLPKTIPLHTMQELLSAIYKQHTNAKTALQKKNTLRDIAVIELLFATGMRISELCSLKDSSVSLADKSILIFGKGSKERKVQIGNDDVIRVLTDYKCAFSSEIQACSHFFANHWGHALSDQSVRRMINKYTSLAAIDLHITPHMFRHTFATCLLEADVDIRYIQEILGHSSIHITELYTHVAMSKQRDILATKHPRKDFQICLS